MYKIGRIESFVYLVINPLIKSLEDEIKSLKNGNLMFKNQNNTDCDPKQQYSANYFCPINKYIIKYKNIYEHYIKSFPNHALEFTIHDELLKKAESMATECFAILYKSSDFVKFISGNFEEYNILKFLPYEAKVHEFIIENIINEIKQVSPYNIDYEFWNKFGCYFRDQAYSIAKNEFQKLKEAKIELLKHSERLLKNLKDQSYELCESYDIPADYLESIDYF